MKNIYEIDGSIIDLSEVQSVSELKSLQMGEIHEFSVGFSAGYVNFHYSMNKSMAIKERNDLIEAIKQLKTTEAKTWIVSEWIVEKNGDCVLGYKYARKLYCIETGETKEI